MVEIKPDSRVRGATAILGLAALFAWQVWVGAGRPLSAGSPAGDPALCLALAYWWAGASATQGLLFWLLGLISLTALTGLSPFWPFLIGWPAWLAVRGLARGRDLAAFLTLGVGLVTLCRCGGKLLLLALPGAQAPLTLSGTSLGGSLWAEAAANLFFLTCFTLLLGGKAQEVSPAC